MNDKIKANCQLFIENRDRIKGEFPWESAYMYPLCAALYTAKGRRANEEVLREAMDLLKARAGLSLCSSILQCINEENKCFFAGGKKSTARQAYFSVPMLFYRGKGGADHARMGTNTSNHRLY